MAIEIKKELKKACRNSVRLEFSGKPSSRVGASRFGGKPDVPEDFKWESYTGADYLDEEVKTRPLAFLAQLDLAEIAPFDTENLLPKTGLLSFFYELETMRWGFDPKDKGCAKVYYFEDTGALSPREFPDDLDKDLRFPEIAVKARSEASYPCYEDFLLQRGKLVEEWEEFEAAEKSLGIEEPGECSKLLGHANIIQGNMTRECELVSRGYYIGSGWDEVTPQDRQEAEQCKDWILLFQLDTVRCEGFELMFGDCGRLYFYIRRQDLEARNFENVWLILQCC